MLVFRLEANSSELQLFFKVYWRHIFPLVFLGIRSAVKEDIGHSSAELLYGEPLRLPGEFFVENSSNSSSEHSTFVAELADAMRKLRPVPPHEVDRPAYVPKDLQSCTRVFIRRDDMRRALQPPYDGPYEVLRRDEKFFFTVKVDGSPNTVSIDRLKPAFVATDSVDSSEHGYSLVSSPPHYTLPMPVTSTPSNATTLPAPSGTELPESTTATPEPPSTSNPSFSPSAPSTPAQRITSPASSTGSRPTEVLSPTTSQATSLTPERPPSPAVTTRAGRRVHFPRKLADYPYFR